MWCKENTDEEGDIIFLSEYIRNDFSEWKVPDEVFIETPTGSGKTTFMLEQLAEHALAIDKEVLLLVNRKILKQQLKKAMARHHGMLFIKDEELNQIKSFDGVTIISYQELQQELKTKKFMFTTLNDERFFYIVFDEIHYILQDATFNRDIIYLLDAIPKINAVKIFASATMDEVKPYLLKTLHSRDEQMNELFVADGKSVVHFQKTFFEGGNIFQYEQKPHYPIGEVRYFQKLEVLAEYINRDRTDDKWLIFVNSKSEARELIKKLSYDIAYLDAEVDEENEVRLQIIQEERFLSKILITTKVLDNGVTLKDRKLKNIVLMTADRTDFIQMLGRKRFLTKEDGINLFIAERSVAFFNNLKNMRLRPILSYVEEIKADNCFNQSRFDDKDFVDFCQKMTIIGDDVIVLSKAAEEKLRLEMEFCESTLNKMEGHPEAFICEQLSWLGEEFRFDPKKYLEYSRANEARDKLIEYLKSIVGQRLDKAAQKDFRERFAELAQVFRGKITDRKSRIAGKSAINKFCEAEGIPFQVDSVDNSKYWMIKEVDENAAEHLCD